MITLAVKKEVIKKEAVDKKPTVSSVRKPIVKKAKDPKDDKYYSEKTKYQCTYHGGNPIVSTNFYRANRGSIYGGIQTLTVCKDCISKIYQKYLHECKGDYIRAMYFVCRRLDVTFSTSTCEGALKHADGRVDKLVGWYFSANNSLHQSTQDSNFDNSEGVDKALSPEEILSRIRDESSLDKTDKQYAIEIRKRIGYDPFEGFNYKPHDLKFLYRDFVKFVEDDDIIADQYKLGVAIQLVTSFHQIRLLDFHMSGLNNNIQDYSENMTKINAISQQRAKLIESVSKITASNKWLGADNTATKNKLAGMIKTYREYNIPEIEENYFDMLTCEAIKKINDISNQSIIQQINFTETTEAEIFKIQRELIESQNLEIIKTKEKITNMANEIYELKNKLDGVSNGR